MEIIPSILSRDPDEARGLLALCEGKVLRAHIDIIDGLFAENRTVLPETFFDSETRVFLDYHLMVNAPHTWIERCARASADRIIAQIEMMEDQMSFVKEAQEAGLDVGLALDIDTDIAELHEEVLPELDVVLVMSVPAGFGGQEFSPQALAKVEALARIREEHGYSFNICDDGGITTESIDNVVHEGADEIAIGRRLFEGDLEENIERFKKAAMRYNRNL